MIENKRVVADVGRLLGAPDPPLAPPVRSAAAPGTYQPSAARSYAVFVWNVSPRCATKRANTSLVSLPPSRSDRVTSATIAHPMPFLSGADLSVLEGLSEGLIVLGLVGVVSRLFFPKDRPNLRRLMGVLFTLMALGGVALIWRIDQLNNADRDLTPDQLAALRKGISQFPGVKFEVHILTGDREVRLLATKIIDAVKAGSGTMPHFGESPSLPPGVILVYSVAGYRPPPRHLRYGRQTAGGRAHSSWRRFLGRATRAHCDNHDRQETLRRGCDATRASIGCTCWLAVGTVAIVSGVPRHEAPLKARRLFWPVYALLLIGATLAGSEAIASFLAPSYPARDIRPIDVKNTAEIVYNDWDLRDRARTFARPPGCASGPSWSATAFSRGSSSSSPCLPSSSSA